MDDFPFDFDKDKPTLLVLKQYGPQILCIKDPKVLYILQKNSKLSQEESNVFRALLRRCWGLGWAW